MAVLARRYLGCYERDEYVLAPFYVYISKSKKGWQYLDSLGGAAYTLSLIHICEIAPVAVFTPVEIDGCEVSRASLHNLSFIEDLALMAGNRILVSKRCV